MKLQQPIAAWTYTNWKTINGFFPGTVYYMEDSQSYRLLKYDVANGFASFYQLMKTPVSADLTDFQTHVKPSATSVADFNSILA